MKDSSHNLAVVSEEADTASHIAGSALGAELNQAECEVLANIVGVKHLTSGEVLVREGDTDSRLFLLVEGGLAVTDSQPSGEAILYRMQVGETAGTRAFVDGRRRAATLRATEASTVYSLEPYRFEALLETHPGVVYKVMRAIFRITHANLMRMNHESGELANYVHKAGGRY